MKISYPIYFSVIIFIWFHDNTNNSNAQETPTSEDQEYNDEIRPDKTIFIERNIQDLLIMDCYTTEGEFYPDIQWLKDGNSMDVISREVKYGPDKYSMRIERLQMQDAGNYKCIDEKNRWMVEFEVKVYDAPEVRIEPQEITVRVGESAKFRCECNSKIPSYMEWYPGVNLSNLSSMDDLTEEQFNSVITDDDNPLVLELKYVTHETEGWYSCLARNGLNTVNASAYLKVIDAGI